MSDKKRKNSYEVEILPELFDAAKAIAEIKDIPIEAAINKAVLDSFKNEHNALIDFHHHCGCGEFADSCFDENYEIGRMNIIRDKLKPYENGLKCICCGDDMDKNVLEIQIRH